MIRSTLSALAGYLVMTFIILAMAMIAWYGLGASFVFDGGSVNVSPAYIVVQLLIAMVAALIAGWTTALAAPQKDRSNATMILVGITMLVGFVVAYGQSVFPTSELPASKSIADLSFSGAQKYAVIPGWFHYVLAIVAASGAFAGSQLYKDHASEKAGKADAKNKSTAPMDVDIKSSSATDQLQAEKDVEKSLELCEPAGVAE